MKKTLIILGSSRSQGHTFEAVKLIKNKLQNPSFIDLANYKITDFDYLQQNKDDDFKQIIEHILQHETIILATPVYWYTMSAAMKRFVDRLTDLLPATEDQDTPLRNKNLAVISSYGVHPEGKDGFETIFINTAKYLSMNYLACYFYYSGNNPSISEKNINLADEFLTRLNKN